VSDCLVGVQAKLARSDEHFAELRSAVMELIGESKASYRREADDNPLPGWSIFVSWGDPVPPRFGAVIGDILTNLRATLDHLAWQLVLRYGGIPTDSTSFPIVSTPRTAPPGISGGGAIPKDVQDLIGDVQPYSNLARGRAAEIHPLHVLKLLVNTDKHCALTVTEVFGANSDIRVTGRGGHPIFARAETPGGAAGERVAWLPASAFPEDEPWEIVATIEPIVAIDVGHRTMYPILDLLDDIRRFVGERVVASLTAAAFSA
jgi:hypothetical protein